MKLPPERCGARLRWDRRGQFCRRWATQHVPKRGKRRCRLHLGQANHHPTGRQYQWKARAAKQAVMKALGLPWYGGSPKRKATLNMADKAIAIANDILETLPIPRDVPDDQKGNVELLGEGVRAGLLLLRDTVKLGQAELLLGRENINFKLLGQANLSALGTVKLGLKAADTGSRHDIIGKLLAAIEAEKEGAK